MMLKVSTYKANRCIGIRTDVIYMAFPLDILSDCQTKILVSSNESSG